MSDTFQQDVSVVIPVFNRAHLLGRAVASCKNPDLQVEVLVVDDGSTEDIESLVHSLSIQCVDANNEHKSRFIVRYVRQRHQGACVARNNGLGHARGEFVKFLDSDDELITAALPTEIDSIRKHGANVVLTGWHECRDDYLGATVPGSTTFRHAPDLANGIDDMLLGRAPWTSAALYRRQFIRDLEWDPAWTKAQDWGWALRVCLAGASFCSLDVPSSVYHHHESGRITNQEDYVLHSTLARQQLLRMVEESLRNQDVLTDPRRKRLAQYYYRDRIMLCDHDSRAWHRLWQHCREIAPGFQPAEANRIVRWFIRLLGVSCGIHAYVVIKRVMTGSRGGCHCSMVRVACSALALVAALDDLH